MIHYTAKQRCWRSCVQTDLAHCLMDGRAEMLHFAIRALVGGRERLRYVQRDNMP